MKVGLKLFASLTGRLPPEAQARHRVDLDVPEGTTLLDLVRSHGVEEKQCAIVLLDGVWVHRHELATRVLSDGQVLAVWPPVAGG